MKKTLKTATALMSAAIMSLSLASCTFVDSIREYAKGEETTIYSSPEDNDVVSGFNKYIDTSVEQAKKYDYSVKYKVNDLSVEGTSGDQSFVKQAAKQLKDLIMAANPGAESKEITDKTVTDTLLANKINPAAVMTFKSERNMVTENITYENEKNVTNENGENITETYVGDNILNTDMLYYLTKTEKDENDNDVEIVTDVAPDAQIEAVFGSLKDQNDVKANFDCVKDYVVLKDYTVKYEKAAISSEINIETEMMSFVKYTTEMTVTANVSGIGSLAQYDDMTVTLKLVKETNYSFTYKEDEA